MASPDELKPTTDEFKETPDELLSSPDRFKAEVFEKILKVCDQMINFLCLSDFVAKSNATKAQRHEGGRMKKFEPLTEKEEFIGKAIVNSAYSVHKALGPGLLEKVYEICFCHELNKRGLAFQRQVDIPICYDGILFDEGLRLDVLVEDLAVCELKAVELVNPVWQAQILSHLKLTNRRLGYLINFDVPIIKEGIKRFVL